MKLEDIGLVEEQEKVLRTIRDMKKGLFIVSGPKKSGVTSTLYALMKNHDPFMNDINILEKSPAGDLENITQHHYSMSDTGTTSYDMKLRSIALMGPNILGVGDCEDAKTVAECMDAVLEDKILHATIEASTT